jgi:hypothetical protein
MVITYGFQKRNNNASKNELLGEEAIGWKFIACGRAFFKIEGIFTFSSLLKVDDHFKN